MQPHCFFYATGAATVNGGLMVLDRTKGQYSTLAYDGVIFEPLLALALMPVAPGIEGG
jgi:hypothetical protein